MARPAPVVDLAAVVADARRGGPHETNVAQLHLLDGLAGEAALYYVQYAEHMVRSVRTSPHVTTVHGLALGLMRRYWPHDEGAWTLLRAPEQEARIRELLAGLAAAVVVFITSEPGKELVAFGRDAWREVKKVVWPTRKETAQTTGIVFLFVVVMALFLWLVDAGLLWLVKLLMGRSD